MYPSIVEKKNLINISFQLDIQKKTNIRMKINQKIFFQEMKSFKYG